MARLHPWFVLLFAVLPPACRKDSPAGPSPVASSSASVGASASSPEPAASASASVSASAAASAGLAAPQVASPEALEANLLRARKLVLSQDCSPSQPIRLRPHLAALVTYTCADGNPAEDTPAAGIVVVGGIPGNLIALSCGELGLDKTPKGGFFLPVRDGKTQALVARCLWPTAARSRTEAFLATLVDDHWQREPSAPEDTASGKTLGPEKTLVFPIDEPHVMVAVCDRAPCSSRNLFRLAPLFQAWDGTGYSESMELLIPVYRSLLTAALERGRQAAAASSASAASAAAASASAPAAPSGSASSGWTPFVPPAASGAAPLGPACPKERLKTPAELLIYSRLTGESLGESTTLADALMTDFPAGACVSVADAATFWPKLRQTLLDLRLPRLTRARGPESPLPAPPVLPEAQGPLFPDCKPAKAPPAQKSASRTCRVKVSKAGKGAVSWQKTSWRKLARLTQTSFAMTDEDPAIARAICPQCCGAGPWVIATHKAEQTFREHTHFLVDEVADGGLRMRQLSQRSGPGADCNSASDGDSSDPVPGSSWRQLDLGFSERFPIYVHETAKGTESCNGMNDGCGRSCVGFDSAEIHFLEPGTLRSSIKVSYVRGGLVVSDNGVIDEPKKPTGEPLVWFTSDDKGLTVHGEECEGPSIEWP